MTLRKPIAATLLFLAFAAPAHAGPLTGVLAYLQGNVMTDIEVLAIIGAAVALFAFQVRWQYILTVCAGIWILANADVIRGAISGG